MADFGSVVSTIHVRNETGLHVGLYTGGQRLGTVTGVEECIPIQSGHVLNTTIQNLIIRVTSESSFSTPAIDLSVPHKIIIGPWPETRWQDGLSLRPAPRCDGEQTDDEEDFEARDQPT
jgi:hypothetical protein